MKNTTFVKAAVAAAITVGFAGQAFAAGYEKSIMWGGRTGSVAGISTSYIMGADALYFNPAGLVAAAPGNEVSLNVSPVWSKFQGPYANDNAVVESKQGFTAPVGLIYSNTLNDSWAFGIGGYISGGSKVKYEDLRIGTAALVGSETKTDLQIGEISAGVAYKINPMWKIGAAYRYVMAKADFSLLQRNTGGAGASNVMLTDLEDNKSAFKVGVQWAPSEATHVGLTYRSETKLDAEGKASLQNYAVASGAKSGGLNDLGTASAGTVFPQAVTLGADHAFNETWVGYGEIAWTNYSEVESITIQNTSLNALGVRAVPQDWKDQWNARLGGEYKGFSWPIRFGYGFTSQVTNDDAARPTFTPPGASHTITAGSGQNFELWGQKLAFNGAAEYTFVSGDANGAAAGTTAVGSDIRAGEHKTNSYALHLGLAYNF